MLYCLQMKQHMVVDILKSPDAGAFLHNPVHIEFISSEIHLRQLGHVGDCSMDKAIGESEWYK